MTQCGLVDKWHVGLIISVKNNNIKDRLKENSHRKKLSMANIMELLLKSFLVYHLSRRPSISRANRYCLLTAGINMSTDSNLHCVFLSDS